MAFKTFPVPTNPQTYVAYLTTGTSWTVPAGVTSVQVVTVGGGAGGRHISVDPIPGNTGGGGQVQTSTVATTPGASISYAIGAGGKNGEYYGTDGGAGGSTTFTGATTAAGGTFNTGPSGALNGGCGGWNAGSWGGPGAIELEWTV